MIDPLKFLPRELQKQELYILISKMIQRVWVDIEPQISTDDPEIIEKLFSNAGDETAARAYYNLYVRPLLGTRTAMDALIKLLGYDVTIQEWFETETPTPAYKFIVELIDVSRKLVVDDFVELIKLIKNERSWPAVIRTPTCASIFYLSEESKLSKDYLSSYEGSLIGGVMVCLYNYMQQAIDLSNETSICGERTTHHIQGWLADPWWTLGYMKLDDVPDEFLPRVLTSRGTIQTACAFPSDADGEYNKHSTYICQNVLSDFGTLSGGEGYIGTVRLAEAQPILSEAIVLSDEVYEEIIRGCSWETYSQFIDQSFDPVICGNLQSIYTPRLYLENTHLVLSDGQELGSWGQNAIGHTAGRTTYNASQIYGVSFRRWVGHWTGNWDDLAPVFPGETNHRSTYTSQLVLSEYQTLSDGVGFVVELQLLDPLVLSNNDEDFELSDNTPCWEIPGVEWATNSNENIDISILTTPTVCTNHVSEAV